MAYIPEMWQLFVRGIEKGVYCTINVADNYQQFQETTVIQVRRLLREKFPGNPIGAEDLRLLYAGRQLEDYIENRKATLGDYNIQRNTTIDIVRRLHGGADPRWMKNNIVTERVPIPPLVEKQHNEFDSSLTFTVTEPDAIMGLTFEDDQPRIKMSCGHAVDINSLTAWCRSLIERHEFEFYCPAIIDQARNTKCAKVWPYEEVRRAAHLTEGEQTYFELKMSLYAATQYCDMKECPGCRSFVERCSLDSLRVHCPICTKMKKQNCDFCWQCGREWTESENSSMKCGYALCEHPDLPAIRNAPSVTIGELQVPNRRACPTCGSVIEHKPQGCKFICCFHCKKEFCFICLESKNICLNSKQSSFYGIGCTPAARQKEIPVWCNK